MQGNTFSGKASRIKFYQNGATLETPAGNSSRSKSSNAMRGEIKGWSSASRRRMRRWMMTHKPCEGRILKGATFTIPGDPLSAEIVRKFWNRFCENKLKQKLNCGLLWRMELQKRGQAHFHCLLAVPSSPPPPAFTYMDIWSEYLKALNVSLPAQQGKDFTLPRGMMPGAERHAVRFNEDDPDGIWLRYLQDHASKAKQSQIVTFQGARHWGIVGRSFFKIVRPEKIYSVNAKQYAVLRRAMARLLRPAIPAAGWPGYRLGYRSKRGTIGVSDWFLTASMLSALKRYAESQRTETDRIVERVGRAFGVPTP